jgi:hypothetical protein
LGYFVGFTAINDLQMEMRDVNVKYSNL